MTCTIDRKYVFNFEDWHEFCEKVTEYDEGYSKAIIIADSGDKIQAVIRDKRFMLDPDLRPNIKYTLYGVPGSVKMMKPEELEVDCPLPMLNGITYELMVPIVYSE